jgi:hypothetical protein
MFSVVCEYRGAHNARMQWVCVLFSSIRMCSERHINGHLNLQVKPPTNRKFAEVLTLLAFGRRLSRLSAEPWLSSQRFLNCTLPLQDSGVEWGHVEQNSLGEIRNAYKIITRKPQAQGQLGRPRHGTKVDSANLMNRVERWVNRWTSQKKTWNVWAK